MPAQDPVYILCHAGGRATKAAQQLAAEGFQQPVVVEGGTQAWVDAGLPVKRGKAGAISLSGRYASRRARWCARRGIAGFLCESLVLRPLWIRRAGLIFAGITDFCGMGLLLARAPWNAARGPDREFALPSASMAMWAGLPWSGSAISPRRRGARSSAMRSS